MQVPTRLTGKRRPPVTLARGYLSAKPHSRLTLRALTRRSTPSGCTCRRSFSRAPALPGDANGDGKVDINDLTIVLANFGKTGCVWSQGCMDGDPIGTVDINDLTIVLTNFGKNRRGVRGSGGRRARTTGFAAVGHGSRRHFGALGAGESDLSPATAGRKEAADERPVGADCGVSIPLSDFVSFSTVVWPKKSPL